MGSPLVSPVAVTFLLSPAVAEDGVFTAGTYSAKATDLLRYV